MLTSGGSIFGRSRALLRAMPTAYFRLWSRFVQLFARLRAASGGVERSNEDSEWNCQAKPQAISALCHTLLWRNSAHADQFLSLGLCTSWYRKPVAAEFARDFSDQSMAHSSTCFYLP